MVLNPYFQQGATTEQNLVQDLVNEQLRMYGVEVYYIPRTYVTSKTVLKEVIESKFENAIPLEAYVDSYDGYEGQGVLMSKFGVQGLHDLGLIISKDRFESYITPLIKNIPNIKLATRPKEGDLIWFPLGDRLFEIKFVEHEKPFYQLQKNYVYELRCELFRYEDEVVDTGIDTVDDNVQEYGYIETLQLIGSASTATASIIGVHDGGVRSIYISDRGHNYANVPRVAISSAPSGGVTAIGFGTMISNIVGCNGEKTSKVQHVDLANPGSGYTVAPSVAFHGGGGVGAAATAGIADGVIGIVSITSGGSGYATVPTISIGNNPTGINTAVAIAYLNAVGIVTQIGIRDAGVGYTVAPTVTISSPNMGNVGDYIFNETVVGSSSSTTARVKSWDATTNRLEVSIASGTFTDGEIITGSESGATHQYRKVVVEFAKDGFAENTSIESAADAIIDFSQSNPFGMP